MGAAAPLARKRALAHPQCEQLQTGALSRIPIMPTKPSNAAAVMYQAGASGEPVFSFCQVTMNWAEPPKDEIDSA